LHCLSAIETYIRLLTVSLTPPATDKADIYTNGNGDTVRPVLLTPSNLDMSNTSFCVAIVNLFNPKHDSLDSFCHADIQL